MYTRGGGGGGWGLICYMAAEKRRFTALDFWFTSANCWFFTISFLMASSSNWCGWAWLHIWPNHQKCRAHSTCQQNKHGQPYRSTKNKINIKHTEQSKPTTNTVNADISRNSLDAIFVKEVKQFTMFTMSHECMNIWNILLLKMTFLTKLGSLVVAKTKQNSFEITVSDMKVSSSYSIWQSKLWHQRTTEAGSYISDTMRALRK